MPPHEHVCVCVGVGGVQLCLQRALGFGLSFPVRRGPYGPTDCLYGEARLRRTSHTQQPRGWRAGHTPPSAVVHVLLDVEATRPAIRLSVLGAVRSCGVGVGWRSAGTALCCSVPMYVHGVGGRKDHLRGAPSGLPLPRFRVVKHLQICTRGREGRGHGDTVLVIQYTLLRR